MQLSVVESSIGDRELETNQDMDRARALTARLGMHSSTWRMNRQARTKQEPATDVRVSSNIF